MSLLNTKIYMTQQIFETSFNSDRKPIFDYLKWISHKQTNKYTPYEKTSEKNDLRNTT